MAQELYDPNSTNYHRWLQRADLAARFAPTAQEARAAAQFLASHNLPVVDVGPNNFYVKARGTIANVAKAFRVQINKFDVNSQTYRANMSDPYVEGAAAALVRAVSGLDNTAFQHPLMTQSLQNRPSARGFESASSAATFGLLHDRLLHWRERASTTAISNCGSCEHLAKLPCA